MLCDPGSELRLVIGGREKKKGENNNKGDGSKKKRKVQTLYFYIGRCIITHSSGEIFQARMLDSQEDANAE